MDFPVDTNVRTDRSTDGSVASGRTASALAPIDRRETRSESTDIRTDRMCPIEQRRPGLSNRVVESTLRAAPHVRSIRFDPTDVAGVWSRVQEDVTYNGSHELSRILRRADAPGTDTGRRRRAAHGGRRRCGGLGYAGHADDRRQLGVRLRGGQGTARRRA